HPRIVNGLFAILFFTGQLPHLSFKLFTLKFICWFLSQYTMEFVFFLFFYGIDCWMILVMAGETVWKNNRKKWP
ncbi:hypothetical protein AALB39_22395, partial [Lachnospiraceae bacterium 54-53]